MFLIKNNLKALPCFEYTESITEATFLKISLCTLERNNHCRTRWCILWTWLAYTMSFTWWQWSQSSAPPSQRVVNSWTFPPSPNPTWWPKNLSSRQCPPPTLRQESLAPTSPSPPLPTPWTLPMCQCTPCPPHPLVGNCTNIYLYHSCCWRQIHSSSFLRQFWPSNVEPPEPTGRPWCNS